MSDIDDIENVSIPSSVVSRAVRKTFRSASDKGRERQRLKPGPRYIRPKVTLAGQMTKT